MLEKYNSNEDFKSYVDKYCATYKKMVDEALQEAIVIAYLDYLESQK